MGGAGGAGGSGGGTVDWSAVSGARVIWDDFSYTTWKDRAAGDFGWRFRNGTGSPGNSDWSPDQIVFIDDPDIPSNRLMRFQSYTNGSEGSSTVQCQASRQAPDCLHGTFAARIRFRDAASAGTTNMGDQYTQTFYMIVGIEGTYADPGFPLTPYAPYDPSQPYSEMDFEVLPHGGWSYSPLEMTVNTWAPDINQHGKPLQNFPAWHVLTLQLDGTHATYSVDGALIYDETGAMPQTPMSMNFNQWFITLGNVGARREYWEDFDWVFFAEDRYLTATQIEALVVGFRATQTPRVEKVF